MIFPYLIGILNFHKAPVTWFIFILCAVIMIGVSGQSNHLQSQIDDLVKNELLVEVQGQIYKNYLSENSVHSSSLLKTIARSPSGIDKENLNLLGTLAFRDWDFLSNVNFRYLKGDLVAYRWWELNNSKILELENKHPSYKFGLSSRNDSFVNWITYQFFHSGWTHFGFNMLFLLFFGCYLEQLFGGLIVLGLYLFSGIAGAAVYILLEGLTGAPLIGASGAISGLMAAACLVNLKKPIKCFYWLFIPLKGYSGWVYVPSGLIFILWLVADLGGKLSTLHEFGGVAYSAHIGGQGLGAVFALVIFIMNKIKNTQSV